jgi:hypothetical protein
MIYIGIDPDTNKSGVAIYNNKDKNIELYNLSFFQLFDYLLWCINSEIRFKVILESGWLNKKSNWHEEKKGSHIASRIGAKTGANHETGKKIEEMLKYFHVSYELKIPKTTKVDAKFFKQMTGFVNKTNQDQRDAALLVWGL